MAPRNGAVPPLARADAESLAGEILGAPIALSASPALRTPVRGTLVDETLSTFVVRVPGRPRPVRVPKAGAHGTIVLDGRELPLRGEVLRVRPEDRTKRLLAPGPRRFR
jgi:RNase P/RNase MRP subunit p29